MTAPALPRSASPFRQPKAVWAVALACVISFMGIGLVDPILPALRSSLHASTSQVSLLFTSYLVVTAVMMLVTNAVSSRIGAKRTLVAGLVLIVAFSLLAGTSHSVSQIVGYRAGWGLGNALFIATSLAVIVSSASGGFTGAIVLYETALGVGIAIGPLLGGLLGGMSWRGPFFGVAALMALALLATVTLVERTPAPPVPTSLAAPIRALSHRGLLSLSIVALLYNWGFFTLLGYSPYPMGLDAHQLGLVFFGWGILVAVFAIDGAPRLQRRFGTARTLYANLTAFAVILVLVGIFVHSLAVLVAMVILAGACIGLNNTLMTQAVMTISQADRPVASAAYGFVRFIGGGLAPYFASRLAQAHGDHLPFYLGALTVLLAVPVLASVHRMLAVAEQRQAATHHSPTSSDPDEAAEFAVNSAS